MDPTVWGNGLWIFIHTIAINYPEKPSPIDKKNVYNFFTNLENVIPCEKCKNNYSLHMKQLPLSSHLNNKNDLFKWTVDMHNMVNSELGKPILTVEQVKNIYKNMYLNKKIKQFTLNNKYLLIIGIVFCIILSLFFLFIRK